VGDFYGLLTSVVIDLAVKQLAYVWMSTLPVRTRLISFPDRSDDVPDGWSLPGCHPLLIVKDIIPDLCGTFVGNDKPDLTCGPVHLLQQSTIGWRYHTKAQIAWRIHW
jgi:hypothetical protein